MKQHGMRLQVRYYRALPTDASGYEHEVLDLDINRTALVVVHCWNIGCPDGPAVDSNFCVGMGWPEAAGEAQRIMREVIRPTMDAARRSGLRVLHVEPDWMDAAYPHVPSRRASGLSIAAGPHREMLDRAHGPDYLTQSPLASMRRCELVAPAGDEPLVFYSDQLDQALQEHGIRILVYAGFAADMCVLGSEGGARAMLGRGYQCILLRDATLGVETPETFPLRLATRYGTHRFEWQVGHSATSGDLLEALSEDAES